MPFCSFSEGAAMFDVTPIENMFLLEYLPAAPGEHLRVYLYARMLCLHPELGKEIGDMAKALHMEEDAVYNAFSYWEQQGLVEKLTDRPATYALRPLRGGAGLMCELDRDYYKYRDYNSALQDMFGAAELLEPKQYEMAKDWVEMMGFTQEAALRLVQYEIRQPGGRKPASVFKRANKRAVEWSERGIRSLDQVERAIAFGESTHALAKATMEQLGIRRNPTLDEMNIVRRWVEEWNLTKEDVVAAGASTTKSRNPSIAYLDTILREQKRGKDRRFEELREILKELGIPGAQATPAQQKSYEKLLERGFEPETVLLAAVQCAAKNRHSFEKLEWMLGEWEKLGIYKHAAAEQFVSDMERNTQEMRPVMDAAGLTRMPTMDDLACFAEWKARHSVEMILCAAELSRGSRTPIKYMNKLLKEWAAEGIATPEAAKARKPAAAKGQAAPTGYQQHEYKEEDFGADFYYDPARDYGEEAARK